MEQQKMDPEIKAQWVEALRSGDYVQGRQTLHDKDAGTYCCIGVLCEVVQPPHWDGECFNRDAHAIVDSLLHEVSLIEGQDTRLMEMNDGTDGEGHNAKTFAQIADYIEENL